MKTKTGWKRLYFVYVPGGDFGFFVFPQLYRIALTFYSAWEQAETWQEFQDYLDSECREYLQPFMQCDETTPRPDSKIDELDDMWIFNDSEFPMTQLAEETYTEVKAYLPLDLMNIELRTEYHHHIGLFPLDQFDPIEAHLDKSGFKVDKVASLVHVDLRNY